MVVDSLPAVFEPPPVTAFRGGLPPPGDAADVAELQLDRTGRLRGFLLILPGQESS
jgi:hypothetical protein